MDNVIPVNNFLQVPYHGILSNAVISKLDFRKLFL
jgi:hypothetical protein